MKNIRVLCICVLAIGLFIATKLHASDQKLGGRYHTLAGPADRLVLKANETAIIDSVTAFDWFDNSVNILYQHGTNDFINISLDFGLTNGTTHLSGPGIIKFKNGAVRFKVVRQNRLNYFNTLAYPTDQLVLKTNEVAIIDSTVGFDSPYNWMTISYKGETNDFVNMMLPIGLTDGTMPLSGPCVIMLNTNDVFQNGAGYTGAVSLRVVRNKPFKHYDTLAFPSDRLVLEADEAAYISGVVSIGGAWVNFLYQRGTNDAVNMIIPTQSTGSTILLSGPSVIRLNTNDVFMFGAEYTGAVGLEVVHNNHFVRVATLAYPSDRLVVNANETAIVTGSIRFDSVYNWMNILYKQGTNEFVNLEVGLESFEEPIRLPGPAVIMLNTNDVFMYGAEYTGAVGIKVIRNSWLDKIK